MKKFLLALIILVFISLSSCETARIEPQERIYNSVDIMYSEPIGKFAFSLNADFTETEKAKYYFDPTIESTEREACIDATEKILSNQASYVVLPEIYIFSQDRYAYKYICDHKLYCSVQDWKSVDYITDVLLVTYGDTAHYGTAFGYANCLAKSFGWPSCEGNLSTPSVIDVLDLNYLCFDESFVSGDDINVAKGIACAFVESYVAQSGEENLRQIMLSDSEAAEALRAYYAKNGISYNPSTIKYLYGGKSYDYIVCSDYADFYVQNDWGDINSQLNPLVTDGFLHSDYAYTKTFFETNINQMKQYQDLFGLGDYNNDLEIAFTSAMGGSKYSFYDGREHRIYLYNVDSLMHEYIHSLTMPSYTMSVWQIEGFARYFSYCYDQYGVAFLNHDYNNTPNIPELKYIHEYLAAVNRPIDMAKDYRDLENIAVYSRRWTNPDENYITGSSFVQYLVELYGEKEVTDYIYGEKNSLPETYHELVKGWNEFINTSYSDYSRYE